MGFRGGSQGRARGRQEEKREGGFRHRTQGSPAVSPLRTGRWRWAFNRSQCLDAAVVAVWLPGESGSQIDRRGPTPRRHPLLGEGVFIRRARRLRRLSGYFLG